MQGGEGIGICRYVSKEWNIAESIAFTSIKVGFVWFIL